MREDVNIAWKFMFKIEGSNKGLEGDQLHISSFQGQTSGKVRRQEWVDGVEKLRSAEVKQ